MAYASGSHRTVFASKYYLVLSWQETSYDVTTNTSTVAWQLSVDATNGYMEASASKSWSVTVDTQTWNGSHAGLNVRYTTLQIASGTKSITHANDGSKTFNFSYSMGINVQFSSGWVYTVSGSSTGTLTTIPRATTPTLSASSVDIGSSVNITVNGAASGFTHNITYTFGSVGGTIATGASQSATISFAPGVTPESPTASDLAAQMANASSGTCTITCATYNGSTLIGTKSVSLTLTAPASWKPTISGVVCAPSQNVFGTAQAPVYANNIDSVVVTFSATGSNHSTVQSAAVTFQGKTYAAVYNSTAGTWSATTNVSTTDGANQPVTIVVVDSRNRSSNTSTTNITVVAYSMPTNTLSVHRANSNGTNNESGNFMLVTIDNSVSSVMVGGVEKNSRTVVLTYQIAGSSSETATIVENSSTLVATGEYANTALIEVANNLTCAVSVTVSDKANSVIRSTNLSVGYCTIDFLDGGRGINFGGTAVNENFVTNMDLVIGGKVQRKNLIQKNTSTCYGTDRTVVFSDNGDGGILINGTNNTSGQTAYREFCTFKGIDGHQYILSSGPNASNNSYVYISGKSINDKTGTGTLFTYTGSDEWSIRTGVAGGKTVTNVVLYPMIRDAGVTDNTWEPYVPDMTEITPIVFASQRVDFPTMSIRCGTKIITSSGIRFRLFTFAEIDEMMGFSGASATNVIVYATNGHWGSNARHILAVDNWTGGTQDPDAGVYITAISPNGGTYEVGKSVELSTFQGASFRVNYVVIRFYN